MAPSLPPTPAVAGIAAAAAAPPPRGKNGRFARTKKRLPARSTIPLTPSEPKRANTSGTIEKGRATASTSAKPGIIAEGGRDIFEDTEEEDEEEGEIHSVFESECEETDSTDELQRDYSIRFEQESKGREKRRQQDDKGKENQPEDREKERLTLRLHTKPKGFGLRDSENKQSPSERAGRKAGADKLAEQSWSPPYPRPSRFQKTKEKVVEGVTEPKVRGRKEAGTEERINSHTVAHVTEAEQTKRTDTTHEVKQNIRGRGNRKGFSFESPTSIVQSGNTRGTKRKSDLSEEVGETEDITAKPEASQSEDDQLPPLPENTICISQFLGPKFFATHMPSLEVIKKRRTSPNTSAATATLVNGVRKSDKIKPAPHHSPVSRRKSLTQKDKDGEERNIDNIIFGDITFKAWYPSWYPKEIIGEKEGKDKEVVSELYVCKKCFGYGKDVMEWRKHVKLCHGGLGKEGLAREIYRYGGWEGDGRWSVWEVDGSVETLFCQNLSLFAKLFLDNKSVFFDVAGFNYFLLVHTSPPSDPSLPPERQIVGFFSKEKMSWDNNNLACILIFPPWQRKGLGALLIGVSYAIAKREGIMGGPEKPISELGMKGYKRFWGAEISRWILEYEIKPKSKDREELDVDSISRDTWIAADDCLTMLREMGVVEKIEEKGGKGLRKENEASVNGSTEKEKEKLPKVRLDKVKVRDWVEKHKLRLELVVSEDGFIEGYALPEAEEEEEEEAEEEETEEVE